MQSPGQLSLAERHVLAKPWKKVAWHLWEIAEARTEWWGEIRRWVRNMTEQRAKAPMRTLTFTPRWRESTADSEQRNETVPLYFKGKASTESENLARGLVQIPVKNDSALGPEGNGHDRGGRDGGMLCVHSENFVPCTHIQEAITKLSWELLLWVWGARTTYVQRLCLSALCLNRMALHSWYGCLINTIRKWMNLEQNRDIRNQPNTYSQLIFEKGVKIIQ